MAHAIVEWTDNLEADGFEIRPVLELIARAMREADGVFPWGGIRVRGIRLTDYVIADGLGDDAFINVTVKMGPGRSAEFKTAFFTPCSTRSRRTRRTCSPAVPWRFRSMWKRPTRRAASSTTTFTSDSGRTVDGAGCEDRGDAG